MTKKTEVLRLTKSEVNVINLIREVGVEKLYTELDNITTSDSNCLKSFKDALLNKPCFTIEQLTEKGVLTQKDATRLLQAYANKENILIAGETGSGKTTLLNAIIKEDTNDKTYTLLLEESKDIDLSRVTKRTNIESVTTEAQGSNLVLSHILAKTVDRLILADVTSLNTTINLLMALTYGTSVLSVIPTKRATTTLDTDKKATIEERLTLLTQGIKHPLTEKITELHTLTVFCTREESSYSIKLLESTTL